MAKAPKTQEWPPYPHIPIYLETSDNIGTSRSYRSISPVVHTPEIRVEKRSIGLLAAASTQLSSIPQNISPTSPATQFTNLSPIWPIPEPFPPPPPKAAKPPPKRPALRFCPSTRPRIQLGTNPREQQPHLNDTTCHRDRKSKLGLGIQDTQAEQSPVFVPSPTSDVEKRSSNIAQRIEEGLWRYSLSGNVIKRWLLEIICWLISAVSMGTVVGFLLYYQNKKIPNWPGSLTLNAFIAVLSKVSGAALILPVSEALGQLKWSWFQGHSKTMWDFEIFDNASRGPWGSFLLLIRTKGRALAALGAIITLFSLALDPFFQQVVDFPDRWAFQGHSRIPVVVQYAPKYPMESRLGIVSTQQDPEIFAATKKFFYENGTQPVPFGNGTRPEIPVACPTGNCTWPIYQTLGVCSRCADVSELLTFTCLNTTVDWIANLTGFSTESQYPNATVCGYFLNATTEASKPVLMSGYLTEAVQSVAGKGSKGETLLTRLLPLTTNPDKKPLFGGSVRFKDTRNPLSDWLIVSAKNGIEGVHRNETPTALECVVSWCVKNIKSSYYQATYEEEVIETFENRTADGFPWASIPMGKNTFTWYRENITINAPDTSNSSKLVQYGLTNDTFITVNAPFDDAFPAVYTSENTTNAVPIMRIKMYLNGIPYQRVLDFNPWAGGNNITRHVERMATAMTNIIRSTPNASHVVGDAFFQEAYVSVRWEWLALPLSLLGLSLIFLVATMKKTAKEGVWKTSAIATLLYGLPDDMQKKIANEAQDGTPRAKAKELKVKLHATQGWRVSGNLFSPMTPKPREYQPPPGWI